MVEKQCKTKGLVGVIYKPVTKRERERERERERMNVGGTMYRVAVSLLPYSCQALWGPHILLSSLTTVLAFLCGSLFISPLFIYFL